jgi:hypothetical protein
MYGKKSLVVLFFLLFSWKFLTNFHLIVERQTLIATAHLHKYEYLTLNKRKVAEISAIDSLTGSKVRKKLSRARRNKFFTEACGV